MARRNWSDIKAEALKELKDRSDIGSRLESWLREAFLEVAYGYRFHELEKTVTFSLGNTNEATFDYIRATDLKFVMSLRDTTNKRKINPASFRYLDSLSDNNLTPRYYCRFAATLLFDGTPTTSISYKLRYKRKITEPIFTKVGTTEVNYPDTPEEWDEVIRLLGVSRGFESLFEPDNANRFETRAQRLIARLPAEEDVDAEDDVATLTVKTS